MSLEIKENWLKRTMNDAVKTVRRWPKRTCTRCSGTGITREETYEGGWDRVFEDKRCWGCSGTGIIGGGQPGLHLWFQSEEERDTFKFKILRMRGIKWTDEAPAVMESQTLPRWEDEGTGTRVGNQASG